MIQINNMPYHITCDNCQQEKRVRSGELVTVYKSTYPFGVTTLDNGWYKQNGWKLSKPAHEKQKHFCCQECRDTWFAKRKEKKG